MKKENLPDLRAFVVCREVLLNSRSPNVISIINIFNELRVNMFPAHIGTICLVALYGGAVGEFRHRIEVWEKGVRVGDVPYSSFFLEDVNALYHATSYLDGIHAAEPKHFVFKAILNDIEVGRTSLGIFKPLGEEPPTIPFHEV